MIPLERLFRSSSSVPQRSSLFPAEQTSSSEHCNQQDVEGKQPKHRGLRETEPDVETLKAVCTEVIYATKNIVYGRQKAS